MIDINIALEGLKGLKEMAPKQFIADNYQGKGNDDAREFTETMELAIAALEKQVAKKPRYYIDNWDHNRPGCPGCPRNEILYAGQKYCKVCGTKIDWSEE